MVDGEWRCCRPGAHRRAVRRAPPPPWRACAAGIKSHATAPIQRLVAAASFAQVLDDMLGRPSPAPPPRAAWTASPGIADPRAFMFGGPVAVGAAWTRAYPRPAVTPSASGRAVIEVHHVAGIRRPEAARAAVASPTPVPPASAAFETAAVLSSTTSTSTHTTHTTPPAAAASSPERGEAPSVSPPPPATPRPAPRVVPIVRARRVLSVKEQRALDRLLLLGARLDDHFSADDLRREYRALALRLHPDRHAHAPAADRAVLAEAFARATASYRCLQAVHGPRA